MENFNTTASETLSKLKAMFDEKNIENFDSVFRISNDGKIIFQEFRFEYSIKASKKFKNRIIKIVYDNPIFDIQY